MAKKKNSKRFAAGHKLEKTHKGHDNHLCSIVSLREMDKVAGAAKNAKFVCHVCGRASHDTKFLCEPVEI